MKASRLFRRADIQYQRVALSTPLDSCTQQFRADTGGRCGSRYARGGVSCLMFGNDVWTGTSIVGVSINSGGGFLKLYKPDIVCYIYGQSYSVTHEHRSNQNHAMA